MADLQEYGFESVLPGGTFFFAEPNPALSAVLVGDRLLAIVTDHTSRVAINYIQRLGDRPHIGDDHIGQMASTVSTEVFIGGYKNDRHVGQVMVGSVYAAADEFGRDAYAQYDGHHDLSGALYAELPTRL